MTMNPPEQKPFSSPHSRSTSAPRPRVTTWRGLSCAAVGLAGATLFAAACSGKPAANAESGEDAAPEPIVASGVNATVIVSKCPDAARVNVKAAQEAIQRLVGPCASVPGGRAHFSATLQPGGNIVLASPEGDPAEGVVPTCVLQNKLSHRIRLKSPCALDVQLDERTVTVERDDAGAPDATGGSPAKP